MGKLEISTKSLTAVNDLRITYADGTKSVERRVTLAYINESVRALPEDASWRVATFYEEV